MDEACELFATDGLNRTGDLISMGAKAFSYYVRAAIKYLYGDGAKGDDEMINGFVSACEHRLQTERDAIEDVVPEIQRVCAHILERGDDFGSPYDDVPLRFRQLVATR